MTKKQIRTLIITFIVVVLIVFIVFLLTRKDIVDDSVIDKKVEDSITELDKDSSEVDSIKPVVRKQDPLELKIESVARNFTERYGTWSTHNKKENFKSAEIYMTNKMKQSMDDFIANNEKLSDDYTDYYGVTTKVLNTEILDISEAYAEVKTAVQQKEIMGDDLIESIGYKNLELELVNQDGDWLVDSAEWE